MTDPAVFLPTALGLTFFVAGLFTYRRDLFAASSREGFGLLILGPVFVAASLAAFAGEHFTAARSLAQLVPKWLPARLFITYFVGAAHLAAALSFTARRCVRWAATFLAIMFALFVLLLWLPNAVRHPEARMAWIITARETTYATGGLALLATQMRDRWPGHSGTLAAMARIWAGIVLIFFGFENARFPHYSPGVPDTKVTPLWVPAPMLIAYLTGILLIAFGIAMFVKKYSSAAGTLAGLLMLLLTVGIYVPEFFLARGIPDQVTAINFVADTLLFSGTLLVITKAISVTLGRHRYAEAR